MNCEWIQERLSAYLDDELSMSERDLVKRHLDTCSDCQAELAQLADVISSVQFTYGTATVPRGLDERIALAIEAVHGRSQVLRLTLVYLVCALLSAVTVLALVLSPVGLFVLAMIRLVAAMVRSVAYLSTVIGHPWFVILVACCILLAVLSVMGVMRTLKTTQREVVL